MGVMSVYERLKLLLERQEVFTLSSVHLVPYVMMFIWWLRMANCPTAAVLYLAWHRAE